MAQQRDKILLSEELEDESLNLPSRSRSSTGSPMFDFRGGSLDAVGETPAFPSSSFSIPLRSRKMMEMFDRKKNWIFNDPKDIQKELEGGEAFGVRDESSRWDSSEVKASGFERFVQGNRQSASSDSGKGSTNRLGSAKSRSYEFSDETLSDPNGTMSALSPYGSPNARQSGALGQKEGWSSGNVSSQDRSRLFFDAVEEKPDMHVQFGLKSRNRFGLSGKDREQVLGLAEREERKNEQAESRVPGVQRMVEERERQGYSPALRHVMGNSGEQQRTANVLSPVFQSGNSLVFDPTAQTFNPALGIASRNSTGSAESGTRINFWGSDGKAATTTPGRSPLSDPDASPLTGIMGRVEGLSANPSSGNLPGSGSMFQSLPTSSPSALSPASSSPLIPSQNQFKWQSRSF